MNCIDATLTFAWGFGIGTFLFFFGIGVRKAFQAFFASDEKSCSSLDEHEEI